jgi:hypothetical protein
MFEITEENKAQFSDLTYSETAALAEFLKKNPRYKNKLK